MDRGDLRHPAQGPDRAIAQQGGSPRTQGDKDDGRPHAGQVAIAVVIPESTDSVDVRDCLAVATPNFCFSEFLLDLFPFFRNIALVVSGARDEVGSPACSILS
jgi:hypothetical protein